VKDVAEKYIADGWAVVPLTKGEKRATSSWQKKAFSPKDFGENDNIALKCGEPSGWRVDVDLDCPEAVEAAKELLPHTGHIHGRPGKPASHYWFICEGARTTQYTDIKGKDSTSSMLVELRSTGGYTMAPPSTHPSGECLSWEIERDFLRLEPDNATRIVRNLAVATLLARHYPGPGARHGAVGPLAGFLVNGGLTDEEVLAVIKTAAHVAGDGDWRDRVAFVKSTLAKHAAGEKVTGGKKLIEFLDELVVTKLRGWLKLKDDDAIEQMNERHFWVRLGSNDCIGREDTASGLTEFQRVKSLYSEYENRVVQVGVDPKSGEPVFKKLFPAWLEHPQRRSYRQVVFAPPPRVASERDYNLWTGFSIEPKAGDWSQFKQHIFEVICGSNQVHFEFLLGLLAAMVQEPGVPGEIAVAMRGKPGTGKGFFVRALGRIFGKHYAHLDKVEDLIGHFNAAISGKVVVFADEAFFAGDKREQGALKRLVTEPTLAITRKGIDTVQEDNCVHLFCATNEHWSIPAGPLERRYLALKVSDAHVQDIPYFTALTEGGREVPDHALAAFLHDMLALPFSRAALRKPPMTKELRDQQSQSLAPELEWWQSCLWTGTIGMLGDVWGKVVPCKGLYEAYRAEVTAKRPLNIVEFGRRMTEFFSDKKSSLKRVGGVMTRVITLQSLADARTRFDTELGTREEWPDETGNGETVSERGEF